MKTFDLDGNEISEESDSEFVGRHVETSIRGQSLSGTVQSISRTGRGVIVLHCQTDDGKTFTASVREIVD